MAAWGNRYSALLQEPSSHKPSPEFSSAFSEPAHASFSPGNDSNVPTKIKYPPNSSVFVARQVVHYLGWLYRHRPHELQGRPLTPVHEANQYSLFLHSLG
jgi:hypothetical protein